MRARTVWDSFRYALAGLVYALNTQRNMRIHCLMAILVALLGYALRLPPLELAILALTVGMVLMAEMFNTALEVAVDLVTQEYHPLAKTAKNVAAGSVLVTAVIAVVVGFLLFFDKIAERLGDASPTPASSSSLLIVISVLCIAGGIGILKVLAGHSRLQGGMPSGHVAVAFGLATTVYLLKAGGTVTLVALILAILVAQSRLEAGIHSWPEVAVGGAIGVFSTLLISQLLLRM